MDGRVSIGLKVNAAETVDLGQEIAMIRSATVSQTQTKNSVKVSFYLILLLVAGMGIELGARLILVYKTHVSSGAPPALLKPYQIPDPKVRNQWRLKPGFSQTLGQAIHSKKEAGEFLGEKHLLEASSRLRLSPEAIVLRINSHGFRGKELDLKHSRLRILTLGDSCTFGTIEDYTYPNVMERECRRLGMDAEVVNGGVEGYSPRNVLLRISEYRALRPEVVTIYLGWNMLFDETQFLDQLYPWEHRFQSLRLAHSALRRLPAFWTDRQSAALKQYGKPKHLDRHALDLEESRRWVVPLVHQIRQLVDEMQLAGSRVVLISLPGLYIADENPNARALQVGHLPEFTNNPFVLARLSEAYNEGLRELARQKELQLIDLEAWSKTALHPRDQFFSDSVHLFEEGQEMIGMQVAMELSGSSSKQRKF